jgi:acyl-CoA thioesterase I
MGDSLSAAYGIPLQAGWVKLLEQRLAQEGYPHRVVNASIAGETAAGGLRRLPAALDTHRPQLVLLQLGANDGLRGLPLEELRRNLTDMVRVSRSAGAEPVLFEMHIPPNYGPVYTQRFHQTIVEVARELDVALVPFLLAEIALDPDMFLDDGIHPSAQAQPRLLDAVWPVLATLLDASDLGGKE